MILARRVELATNTQEQGEVTELLQCLLLQSCTHSNLPIFHFSVITFTHASLLQHNTVIASISYEMGTREVVDLYEEA